MPDAKLCFISYARANNRDRRLQKFIEKLGEQLLGHLPSGTRLDDLTFFDVRDIESGDQWMERLSDAARHSKICICFYSKPYFTSEYGGREVKVFLLRFKKWQEDASNAGKEAKAIIPVIWIPEKVPTVLDPFQFDDDGFPALYKKEGLLSLALRTSRRDAYNAVLYKLAERIAKTVETLALPDGEPIVRFDQIASAFHETQMENRYGIAVVALTDATKRSKPFAATETSLPALVERVSNGCRAPFRELPITGDVEREIRGAVQAREMVLLLADQAALDSAANEPLVRKIRSALDSSATALVFSDPLPDAFAAATSMQASADRHFAHPASRCGSYFVASDPQTLVALLEKRLSQVRAELIRADPPTPAQDAALVSAAASKGISLETKPIVDGPGA